MTKSSFYGNSPQPPGSPPAQNPAYPSGGSQTPSSFYPGGGLVPAVVDSDGLLAQLVADKAACDADAAAAAASASASAASAAAASTVVANEAVRYDAAQALSSGQKTQARTNIGLATVAATGAYSDLTGQPTLGSAAAENVGTTTGTVAAGDDSRITGAAQKANNLSDLANATTARTNLGLGTAATQASTVFAQVANNLSDLASKPTARTNLGLGVAMHSSTASGTNVSTTANSSTETNEVMAGQAFTFTPSKIGTVLAFFQATMKQDSGNIIDFEVHYGTGTPPTAGAAYTGTVANFASIQPASTGEIMETPLASIISGLTVGTTYWVDIAYGGRGGGTSHIFNSSILFIELVA